jgi:hypothetical protein
MAWPGPRGSSHMLVIGIGCAIDAPESEIEAAMRLARTAPATLFGDAPNAIAVPNAIEKWSNLAEVSIACSPQVLRLNQDSNKRQIYGSHYPKLLELRARYDPARRFKGHVNWDTTL